MANFIKSTADLQQYVRINVSTLKESWLPYQPDAIDKYMQPYLGEDLIAELDALATNAASFPSWATDAPKQAIATQLLKLAANAASKFTLYLLSPHIDLSLSEMGFVVMHNAQVTPASAERVKNARDAYLEMGYSNMETLLRYLEKNIATITTYQNSDAYLFATANFIQSAEEFNKIISIDGSRLRFISLKPDMTNMEQLHIDPVISAELANELRTQIRAKNVSDLNKKILVPIQRATAYLTMAEVLRNGIKQVKSKYSTKEQAEEKQAIRMQEFGQNYIAQARRILLASPDDYPLFKASDQYTETPQFSHFEYNDDENKFFVAGHP